MDYIHIGAILMVRREVVEVAVFRHVLSTEADAWVLAQDFGERGYVALVIICFVA